MKRLSNFYIFFLLLSLLGCSKVEYDHKNLGFDRAEEMQAAFLKGYHTKQKLDEMIPSQVNSPSPALPEPLPAAAETVKNNQKTEANNPQENSPFAPSFDCSKASNKVEKIICDDRELSMLDVELSKLYKAARENSHDKDQLKNDQISWIKLSRACEDKSCIKSALEMRLKQLKK